MNEKSHIPGNFESYNSEIKYRIVDETEELHEVLT